MRSNGTGTRLGGDASGTPKIISSDRAESRSLPAFYRPELDALRFFAFFLVFLYHLSFGIPGQGFWTQSISYVGAFGMCLFFLLSSYLITELLRRERARTGTIHLRAFYMRRILRIWPLYFVVLLVNALIGKFLIPSWAISRGAVLSFLLLSGNWYILGGAFTAPVFVLWSISVEEQFYLVWPRLMIFGDRALRITAVLLIPLSYLLIVHLVGQGVSYPQIWWNSGVQFQFFGIGALLAFNDRLTPRFSGSNRIAMLIAALCIWVVGGCLNHWNELGVHPALSLSLSYAAAATGSVLIFHSVLGLRASLVPQWLIYLGKRSYGLYVFHQFCLSGVKVLIFHRVSTPESLAGSFILGLTLTIGCAALSYKYLETPFLRLKKHFEFVKSRPI